MIPVKRTLAFASASVGVAVALGIALVALGHGKIGWWLVLSGVIGSAVVAVAVIAGQRSLARMVQVSSDATASAGEGGPGVVSAPGSDAPVRRGRWVGSASVPGPMGYMEIGVFLAVAEVSKRALVLRVRPAIIRLMFGIENLRVAPGEGAVIFPAHKLGQTGIEIRREGRPSYYFWTGHRDDLLAALHAAGFEVSAEEQRMRRR